MPADFPFILARAVVQTIERVSPTFARVTFGGHDLSEFGNPGRVFDQRIKLIFPSPGHTLPELTADVDWYTRWAALPEQTRGAMRTYSIRDLIADQTSTTVAVDFVLHLAPGATGPASRWASEATVGDELLMLGPRRGHPDAGGIEFAPGGARSLLLAGDETAAPAIARILEDLGPDARGAAFIEVPDARDILSIAPPPGVTVTWLPRSAAAPGALLIPAVLDHLGSDAAAPHTEPVGEELLWETPHYSGLGEHLPPPTDRRERYFWIAGESSVVTTLRRHLVSELGVNRADVAFMGYWRAGVAMRA